MGAQGLELTVLGVGWLLGGGVGLGTLGYALLIGPIVHAVLPRVTVALAPLPEAGGTTGRRVRRRGLAAAPPPAR